MKDCGMLLLKFILLILFTFCSSNDDIQENQQRTLEQDKIQKINNVNDLLSDIPIYDDAVLEETKDCPGKWTNCDECKQIIYVTNDDPEKVCTFYKEEMKKRDWIKITYQFYQEGSCLATWMKSNTRLLFNASKRRSDRKTFISFTIGRNCP